MGSPPFRRPRLTLRELCIAPDGRPSRTRPASKPMSEFAITAAFGSPCTAVVQRSHVVRGRFQAMLLGRNYVSSVPWWNAWRMTGHSGSWRAPSSFTKKGASGAELTNCVRQSGTQPLVRAIKTSETDRLQAVVFTLDHRPELAGVVLAAARAAHAHRLSVRALVRLALAAGAYRPEGSAQWTEPDQDARQSLSAPRGRGREPGKMGGTTHYHENPATAILARGSTIGSNSVPMSGPVNNDTAGT